MNRIPLRFVSTRCLPPRHYSTTNNPIQTVGVIGAGQMGNGIALVAAMNAKKNVVLVDSNQKSLDNAMKFIDKLLVKYVSKQTLTQDDKETTLSRFKTTTKLDDLAASDFVIEAATENTALKQTIFKNVSDITKQGTILATNTSSISITLLGSIVKEPQNVIGMHFMNPVPVMKLVEVIRGLATSNETYERTIDLAGQMNKTCTLSKDSPGFIANRILMPYINEAIQTLHEGIATKEDIDTTMKLGTNVPMGPLTLADFIGLDTCLAIMKVLYNEFADSKYRPSPLLVKMVEAGWLGKKSGRGFYQYE
ncbi:3-hydroxybutyryl-CoA dehydrogenase [Acrasis kona]|uniref:3-hydroxybutyryl-CoA dehydrogenase n=1 Tax=Acrasis kona TaxID=1008807 RepID=A0AAW2YHW1_9EUKA